MRVQPPTQARSTIPTSRAVNSLRSSTRAHTCHVPRNTREGSGFRRCRIDYRLDLGDGVGREPALAGVLTHQLLDLGAELVKDTARLLRDRLQLLGGELARSRPLSL